MTKTIAICLLLLLGLTSIAFALTLRVPSQYPTIQEGINAAQHGDTVMVAPQTYSGPNNRALDFLGKQILVTSETGPAQTIIDCQNLDRGAYFHTGETSTSILEGFTIQNGYAPSEEAGGGIICLSASPTIRDNVITNCEAYWGGGIGCLNAWPLIENNSIINNHGERGGGLALLANSNAVLRGNLIQDNIAAGG